MSDYQDRIKELKKRWKTTKAAQGNKGQTVPEGKYQAELVKAAFDQEKYIVRYGYKVAAGEYSGRMLYARDDLLRENEDPQKSGLAFFKANMSTLGVDYSSPDPARISKSLKEAIGTLCDVYVKHDGVFQNVYLNGIIDAPSSEDEEEEAEEEEDEEDTEDDEDEDEDAEEVEDEDDEDEEEEEAEEEPLFPEGQLVTFEHEGHKYEGRYKGPANEGSSIVLVKENEDEEEEEWEVDNESLTRKPGRPKGAKNKKGRSKRKLKQKENKKKKEAEAETDDDLEDDEEWDDEWE